MRLFILVLVLFVAISSNVLSQHPPCDPDRHTLTFEVPLNQVFAPLSTSMPLDVVLSYFALDSAVYHGSYQQMNEFLARQTTFNDTLKQLMKYYYKMVDENPILFESVFNYDDVHQIYPDDLKEAILSKIIANSSSPYLDNLLLKSSLIAKVIVSDTISRPNKVSSLNPNPNWEDFVAIAECNVLDKFKGNKFFKCKDISLYPQNSLLESSSQKLSYDNIEIGDCIQFQYKLSWNRNKNGSDDITYKIYDSTDKIINPHLIDDNGEQWLKKDKEYLVFLRINIVCASSTNEYYTVSPFIDHSETCNMYPIVNGILQDPGNELGLGTEVNYETVKTAIEARIITIINY
jgi:hypothetical protein